jgi:stalled ribosome rescue protein Dom34
MMLGGNFGNKRNSPFDTQKRTIMKNNEKKSVGIWLDHTHAMLIAANEAGTDYQLVEKVKSHQHHYVGGSESARRHGGQEELHKFFEDLGKHIGPYSDVLLFGPGTAQEEFFNFLNQHKQYAGKKYNIDTASHLTDAQMVAKVRDFFGPVKENA